MRLRLLTGHFSAARLLVFGLLSIRDVSSWMWWRKFPKMTCLPLSDKWTPSLAKYSLIWVPFGMKLLFLLKSIMVSLRGLGFLLLVFNTSSVRMSLSSSIFSLATGSLVRRGSEMNSLVWGSSLDMKILKSWKLRRLCRTSNCWLTSLMPRWV